jgi:hypothetical protein
MRCWVNRDGQTVVTHHRNGHKPGQAQHVFLVTRSALFVARPNGAR